MEYVFVDVVFNGLTADNKPENQSRLAFLRNLTAKKTTESRQTAYFIFGIIQPCGIELFLSEIIAQFFNMTIGIFATRYTTQRYGIGILAVDWRMTYRLGFRRFGGLIFGLRWSC